MLKSAASFAINRLVLLVIILVALKFYAPSSCQFGGGSIFDQVNRALPRLATMERAFQ